MNEAQKLRILLRKLHILLDPAIPDKQALMMCEGMDDNMIETEPVEVDSPYFADDWTDERPYHD